MPWSDTDGSGSERLAKAMLRPACYPHPVEQVQMLETHISRVFLTGEFAYKTKKPVDLGFLDFSSLDKRRKNCEEELRLNRRTAAELYLEVVTVNDAPGGPCIDGPGPAIEYAVKMRQFPQQALFDAMARSGALQRHHVEALADVVAAFHEAAARADATGQHGLPEQVLATVRQNFTQLQALVQGPEERQVLDRLAGWSEQQHLRLAAALAERRLSGRVLECHGDLHLGNVALIRGRPVPFDCIEFSDELRWIDSMSEIAFVTMDLADHSLPALAAVFLNRYLELNGDYAGLAVLRFFEVYRALVRAKVARMKAGQLAAGSTAAGTSLQDYRRRLDLALRLSAGGRGALIIMHGLSGSGKTTVSQSIVERSGAVRLRSDVERKRLHGLDALARSGSGLGQELYAAAASDRTYARLGELARAVIDSGRIAVLDAAFLERHRRDAFRQIAREAGVPFAVVACEAAPEVLRDRIAQRERAGGDASEAGLAVLEHQLRSWQPLDAAERVDSLDSLEATMAAATKEENPAMTNRGTQ